MSAKLQLDKYFEALRRLKERGAPISNDAVALEAGSGRGAIKKSRAAYTDLIAAIEAAATERGEAKIDSDPTLALDQKILDLALQLDQALERELCLLNEVYSLREENRQLKMGRPVAVPKSPRL